MKKPVTLHTDQASTVPKGASCMVSMTSERAEMKGAAWIAVSFLFCPCHLPLTLALAAMLLSGTAAAALLHDHPYAAGAVITAVWLAGTWRGIRHFRSAKKYADGVVNRRKPAHDLPPTLPESPDETAGP